MSNKIRLSGLISGMDTDSIISQLVSVKKTKVTQATNAQTKLSWKQDVWSDINKELKSLQSTIGNMRFSTAFQKKTTTVSNPNKASVITDGTAVNSVQSLQINRLAKTAYLTGGTVEKSDGSKATALTTMGDLGFTGNGMLEINGGEKSISVTSSTSISDVINQLKDAGLNASFDKDSQRLFISAKESGKAADFTITASGADGETALAKLGLQSQSYYSSMAGKSASEIASEATSTAAGRAQYYAAQYQSLLSSLHTRPADDSAIRAKYAGNAEVDLSDLDTTSTNLQKSLKEMKTSLSEKEEALNKLKEDKDALEKTDTSAMTTEEKTEHAKKITDLDDQISSAETEYNQLKSDVQAKENVVNDISDLKALGKMQEITANINITFDASGDIEKNADGSYAVTATSALTDSVKNEIQGNVTAAQSELANSDSTKYATKIEGTDAQITLNGAKFTSTTNVFKINGLTITTNATTEAGEELTLTTQNDNSGIQDVVKNFLKTYNTVINKLDSLYNAESAKGYEPLSDEEKEAMSESEAEKYEQKIKDALLKGDSTVNSITEALSSIASQGYKVGDKTYYLSDFGIATLSYFSSKDNEKHALHLDGDPDDAETSGNTNKLAQLIASNPDVVSSFFTKLSQDLYSKMNDLSSSVNGYRTYGSFYDDKAMKTEYDNYKDKIQDLEDKMNDYEDKLYKQYSAMETAMAKLQSKSNALSSYLGTGS